MVMIQDILSRIFVVRDSCSSAVADDKLICIELPSQPNDPAHQLVIEAACFLVVCGVPCSNPKKPHPEVVPEDQRNVPDSQVAHPRGSPSLDDGCDDRPTRSEGELIYARNSLELATSRINNVCSQRTSLENQGFFNGAQQHGLQINGLCEMEIVDEVIFRITGSDRFKVIRVNR